MRLDIDVSASAAALADRAAERIAAAGEEAIRARGRFVLALAGGSTPRATYERLAAEPLASRLAWTRVHVVWGDERCVPPTEAESNYGMAREALLERVPIPSANVHRIHGEGEPAAEAERYEATLRALLETPSGPPRTDAGARIDLVLLGLGVDGHTASLFPGSTAILEPNRWAMATRAGATLPWRVTLTPPLINAATEVLFVVAGGAKADVLQRVLDGVAPPDALPARAIVPRSGHVRWYVDAAAAANLSMEAQP